MDARKEGAPIIAIAGDVETHLIDTAALEELNPYQFFEAASLYTGRVVNPEQVRPIVNTAIMASRRPRRGPTVISLPGDIASANADSIVPVRTISRPPVFRPSDEDLDKLAKMIDDTKKPSPSSESEGCRGRPR